MNRQSSLFQEIPIEIIRDIFVNALQEEIIWEAILLDGGLFNTTYIVEYGSFHKKAVLRLGPVNRHLLMGFEENLMNAEVYTYSVCQTIGVPCSKVLACDTSKQVIDRDFMIVEYIPSIVMSKADLTEEKRNMLYRQMGIYLTKFHQVTGDSFGFLSRICSGKKFDKWSGALIFEVEDMTERLEKFSGLSAEEAQTIRHQFEKSRELLDEIRTPHLLHTDLWEGNVLLNRDTLEIAATGQCMEIRILSLPAHGWTICPCGKDMILSYQNPPVLMMQGAGSCIKCSFAFWRLTLGVANTTIQNYTAPAKNS